MSFAIYIMWTLLEIGHVFGDCIDDEVEKCDGIYYILPYAIYTLFNDLYLKVKCFVFGERRNALHANYGSCDFANRDCNIFC